MTIDYRQPGVNDTARGYRSKPHGPLGAGKDLAYRAFRAHGARARGAVFEQFLQQGLRLTPERFESHDALTAHAWPEDAYYCVGSDQVWNLEASTDIRPYYLAFAPRGARKFSLASSIGMSQLPAADESSLVEALRGFSGISARERDAVAYLNSLGVPAEWHIDPTLAVTRQDWSAFAGGAPARSEPYVLVYQLNRNPVLQTAALAVGRELGLPVVRMEYWQTFRGRSAETVMRPSVEQFVALIRDASVLVSDSFHGAAFALNLGTRLVSVHPPKYVGRLDSLLTQFGLESMRAHSAGEAVDVVREHDELPDRTTQLAEEQEKVRRYIAQMVQEPTSGNVCAGGQK